MSSVSEYFKAHLRSSMKVDVDTLDDPSIVMMLPFFKKPAVSYSDWVEEVKALSGDGGKVTMSEDEKLAKNQYYHDQMEREKAEKASAKKDIE